MKLKDLQALLKSYNKMAWDNVTVHRAGGWFYFKIKGRETVNMRYDDAHAKVWEWIGTTL